MKLFQKMNSRDRSLLILLLAVVVFYLCYSFIMTPAMTKTEMLKADLMSTQEQLSRAHELSGKTDELKIQEKQLRADITKKYSIFLFDLNQSRLLNKVDALMISAGLPPAAYIPTPEAPSQVPVEQGAYAPPGYPLKDLTLRINPNLEAGLQTETQGSGAPAAEGSSGETAAAVESSDMIPGTDVTVGFKTASYESIVNFISSVEKMNKTVVVKNVDISKDETGLTGQLILSFYSLPKLDPDQKDGLDFVPAIPKGKANPFI